MGSKFQLSPGVNVTEIDLTGFVPSVATTGGAMVGEFVWGPVDDYTIVSDSKKLEQLFGKPTENNFIDWFTGYNFLAYSNNLNVVRVVSSDALNASDDGAGELVKNETDYSVVASSSPTAKITAKYPGALGSSLRIEMADAATFSGWTWANEFDSAPGTSTFVAGVGGSNDEMHIVIIDEDGAFTGVPGSLLEKYSFVSKAKDGVDDDGGPKYYGNVLNTQSAYVWYFDVPDAASYAVTGAVTQADVTYGGVGYTSAPTVAITGETGAGAGFTGTAVLETLGDVKSVAVNNGGTGYSDSDVLTLTAANGTLLTVTVTGQTGGVIDTVSVTTQSGDFTADETAIACTGGTGGDDATFDTTIGFAVASITIDTAGADYTDGVVALSGGGFTTPATVVTTLAGAESDAWNTDAVGTDYKNLGAVWAKSLAGGADGTDPSTQEYSNGWDLFANSEVVDVSLLVGGSCGGDANWQTIAQKVLEIAISRKDCVAFISPKSSDVVNVAEQAATENVIASRNSLWSGSSTSYGVMDSGWKYQYDAYNDKYRWLPLNADTAGTAARTDLVADPWWSPAGYTRGQIKNVIKLALNPSKAYRDELYKNSINPIVSFKGEGVVLYGDRTLFSKPSAFQKLNVRRLFIVLEKAISRASKYLLFEFNDSFTRAQFVNLVEPYLREVKGRRGIYDFRVICDESNNTGEVIDRSEFVGDIYIKPAQSINFIQLNFIAVRTGVEFEEVVGQFG